jgi:hypothetical protein
VPFIRINKIPKLQIINVENNVVEMSALIRWLDEAGSEALVGPLAYGR